MRAFSTLIIATAFVLSANAASFGKRAISAPVQLCIDDINAVSSQVTIVKTDVLAFTRAGGYPAALAIHNKEQVLETNLKKAGTDCCAIASMFTSEEADAIVAVVSDLVPEVHEVLEAIIDKKPEFDAILLATSIVKNDVKNLDTQTKTLVTCIVSGCPDSHLPIADELAGRINDDFTAAKIAYGI